MSEERFFFLNKKGERLAAVLHSPKKKTDKCVIFCHGFTGSKEHWKQECDRVEELGLAGFRFDFSGCGESEGDFAKMSYSSEVDDLVSAIDLMQKQGFKSIGVLGHSFGGAVVILASAKDPRIAAVIATAPTVFPNAKMLAKYAKEHKNVTMSPQFFEGVKQLDVVSAAKKRSCPLFIISGTADDVVPVEQSKKLFAEAQGPKELKLIEGAGHNFEGHESEFVGVALEWMKKKL